MAAVVGGGGGEIRENRGSVFAATGRASGEDVSLTEVRRLFLGRVVFSYAYAFDIVTAEGEGCSGCGLGRR